MLTKAYNPDVSIMEKLTVLSKELGKQSVTNLISRGISAFGKNQQPISGGITVEYLPTNGLENIGPIGG